MDNSFLDNDIFACLDGDATDVTMATRMPLISLSSEDGGDLFPLDTSLSVNDPSDFCEVFTDLSSLLQETETNSDQVMAAPSSSNEMPDNGRKRKASELDSAPVIYTDHDDYTIKVKRHKPSDSSTAGSSTEKDEKYVERRQKNNIASRRSRETRKQKHLEMEMKADELEKRNTELREKVAELEKLTKEMKEVLVQKLAGK